MAPMMTLARLFPNPMRPGHISAAHQEDEQVQQQAYDKRRAAIDESAAEDGTETGGAEGGSERLLPHGFGRRMTDRLQPFPRLLQRTFPRGDIITELVHLDDLLELDGPDGDELHVGIGRCLSAGLFHLPGAAGGENAVREDEEVAFVHPEIGRYPGHDILHARNLRSVLEQDMSGNRGHLEDLGKVVLLFHGTKISYFSKCW